MAIRRIRKRRPRPRPQDLIQEVTTKLPFLDLIKTHVLSPAIIGSVFRQRMAAMMAALFSLSAAFVVPSSLMRAVPAARSLAPMMKTNIPRIELPSAVDSILKEQDLNNPNKLDDDAYNTYSAAAIGGTLLVFLLPIFNFAGFFPDFILSALIGGGAAAYCSLRNDVIGEYANKAGGYVMMGIDKGVEAAPGVKAKIEDLIKQLKN